MVNAIVVDLETTVLFKDKGMDGRPVSGLNHVVCGIITGEDGSHYFTDVSKLIEHIKGIEIDTLVCHNGKFDLSWLKHCGLDITKYKLWDTMLYEYLKSAGVRKEIGYYKLAHCLRRRGLQAKKDILGDYLDKKINTDKVPATELEEYTRQDGEVTWQLYAKQLEESKNDAAFLQVFRNTCRFTKVLIDIELYGCKIDTKYLHKLKEDTIKERDELQKKLTIMAQEYLGDRPFNLNSPEDISILFYGLEFKDRMSKKAWGTLDGMDEKNQYVRKGRLSKIKDSIFAGAVDSCFNVAQKQKKESCKSCLQLGKIPFTKKDGSQGQPKKCQACDGEGFVYINIEEDAGLGLPFEKHWATANGFSCSKKIIDMMDVDIPFVYEYKRYNALETYLSMFIGGIEDGLIGDTLYSNIHQHTTATARCSATSPNWFNFPRDSTYPIRNAVISAFEGGKILKVDASGLEFRGAGALSNCSVIASFIADGTDIHTMSRDFMIDHGAKLSRDKEGRQAAKAVSFAPTYGGHGQNKAEKAWCKHFVEYFEGLGKWHTMLKQHQGFYTLPSGRSFWYSNNMSNTQKVNYPVQSFCTACIMPLLTCYVFEEAQRRGLQSRIINVLYDDISVDVHPEEINEVLDIFHLTLSKQRDILKEEWNYELPIPLDFEFTLGDRWGGGEVIHKTNYTLT